MNMKFRNLKYAMYGLASLLFVNCTEEDNKVKVPEYTKFENPEWIAKRKEQEETADEIKARLKENDCHGYYLIQFPGSDTISYSL